MKKERWRPTDRARYPPTSVCRVVGDRQGTSRQLEKVPTIQLASERAGGTHLAPFGSDGQVIAPSLMHFPIFTISFSIFFFFFLNPVVSIGSFFFGLFIPSKLGRTSGKTDFTGGGKQRGRDLFPASTPANLFIASRQAD